MKLACFSETQAAADAEAAQPEAVDQAAGADLAGHRVDEHRAGVLPAGLVLPPPAHDVGQLGLGIGPVTGLHARSPAVDDHVVVGEVRRPEAQPERRRVACRAASRRCAGRTRRRRRGTSPCRNRGRRRSCAPLRRSSRARRRPTRTRASRPTPAAGRPRAAPPRRRRWRPSRSAAGRPTSRSPSSSRDRHGDAGEAGVGDEQVGAPADDEHRQVGRLAGGATRRRSSSVRGRTNSAAGPPTR